MLNEVVNEEKVRNSEKILNSHSILTDLNLLNCILEDKLKQISDYLMASVYFPAFKREKLM